LSGTSGKCRELRSDPVKGRNMYTYVTHKKFSTRVRRSPKARLHLEELETRTVLSANHAAAAPEPPDHHDSKAMVADQHSASTDQGQQAKSAKHDDAHKAQDAHQASSDANSDKIKKDNQDSNKKADSSKNDKVQHHSKDDQPDVATSDQ